jgi:hypothetical protein
MILPRTLKCKKRVFGNSAGNDCCILALYVHVGNNEIKLVTTALLAAFKRQNHSRHAFLFALPPTFRIAYDLEIYLICFAAHLCLGPLLEGLFITEECPV